MSRLPVTTIEGAFPALDRKKIEKPFVADGKNFIVDSDGPRSAFGYQAMYERFDPNEFIQDFQVGSSLFYFSRDAVESFFVVSEVDWPARQIVTSVKLISSDLSRPRLNFPWTHAFVGSYHYFANRTFGILRYDAIERSWEDVTATIGVDDIFYICESDGRLCALAEGLVSWSAIDDGMDNTPSAVTGAGFQALSKIGTMERDADYLGMLKTSKGFCCFTSKGVLRFEQIDSVSPFRSLTGESHYQPITPWCLTKLSDTRMIMLSRFGLSVSDDGHAFQAFEPLQSEFFKLSALPALPYHVNGYIRLYYAASRDELYVSIAQSEIFGKYTKAWVLYSRRETWGLFNHTHQSFVRVDPELQGSNFEQGYINSDGKLCHLDNSSISFDTEAENEFGVYVQKLLPHKVWQVDGVWVMPADTVITGFSLIGFPELASWYEETGVKNLLIDSYPISTLDMDALYPTLFCAPTISVVYSMWVVDLPDLEIGNSYTIKILFYPFGNASRSIGLTFTDSSSSSATYKPGTGIFFVSGGSAEFQILDSGLYELSLTFTPSAPFSRISFSWSGFPPDFTNLKSFSLFDVADPEIELLSVTDPVDASGFIRQPIGHGTYTQAFGSIVSTRSQMAVLDKVMQPLQQSSLDSFVELGLFRFTDDATSQEFSLITNVDISCLDPPVSIGDVIDDWQADYETDIFEDWLTFSPETEVDYGYETVTGSTYTQKIRGTLDGYQTFEDQYVEIDEVAIEGKTKFCTCSSVGIYQTVIVNALDLRHSYHVKTLELNGILAGRY